VLTTIMFMTTNSNSSNLSSLQRIEQAQREELEAMTKLLNALSPKVDTHRSNAPYYLLPENQLRPSRNVFFDLGANRGDSTMQFVGLEKTSGIGGNLSEQLYQIPKRVPGPWDIRMYEAHPRFDQQLIETKRAVELLDSAIYGGPFHVYNFNTTAIGWEEGTIDFYLDVRSDVKWGSSLYKDHPDVNISNPAYTIKVPIHDLVREIMNNYRVQDYVVVKMDIEGIEYDLLMELLLRGAFPFIDELYVEFHWFVKEAKVNCVKWTILELAKKYMKIG